MSGEQKAPVFITRKPDDQFTSSYSQVDASVDEYIQSRGEYPIPAINELRYAVRHLIDAVLAPDKSKQKESWERALRHVDRARYDIPEYECGSLRLRVEAMLGTDAYKRYHHIVVKCIPNYYRHMIAFYETYEELKTFPALDKNSSVYEQRCNRMIRTAQEFLDDIIKAEPLICAAMEKEDRRKRNFKIWKISIFFGMALLKLIVSHLIF